jgi:hypothetical protein
MINFQIFYSEGRPQDCALRALFQGQASSQEEHLTFCKTAGNFPYMKESKVTEQIRTNC